MNDTEERKSVAQRISDFLRDEAQCWEDLENAHALGENIYDLIVASLVADAHRAGRVLGRTEMREEAAQAAVNRREFFNWVMDYAEQNYDAGRTHESMDYEAVIRALPLAPEESATPSEATPPTTEEQCPTCGESGIVGGAPDNYFPCPDCSGESIAPDDTTDDRPEFGPTPREGDKS